MTGTQAADANREFFRAVNRWQLAFRSRTADLSPHQTSVETLPVPKRPQPPTGHVQVKSELQLPSPPPPAHPSNPVSGVFTTAF